MEKETVFFGMKKILLVSLFSLLLTHPLLSHTASKTNMRGARYCEIIIEKSLTNYSVYNTWGLNDCPEAIWGKITVENVKKETGSATVHLNGPRYWVIDGYKNSKLINPTIRKISGLPVREAGVIHISLFDLLKSYKPYQIRNVQRTTTWVYKIGKPIYELIDTNGDVYVMQSFSTQSNKQTLNSLSHLESQLNLPTGWHFKTGILKKQELLKAKKNHAVVVQDSFSNTYQLATHDFLSAKQATSLLKHKRERARNS